MEEVREVGSGQSLSFGSRVKELGYLIRQNLVFGLDVNEVLSFIQKGFELFRGNQEFIFVFLKVAVKQEWSLRQVFLDAWERVVGDRVLVLDFWLDGSQQFCFNYVLGFFSQMLEEFKCWLRVSSLGSKLVGYQVIFFVCGMERVGRGYLKDVGRSGRVGIGFFLFILE